MKKIIPVFLVLSLLFTLCSGLSLGASANDFWSPEFFVTENPDGTCTINYYVDYDPWVEDITIPDYVDGMKVTGLGGACFMGFEYLRHVSIPDGVTLIDGSAFYDCPNLQSLTLPAGLTTLSPMALYNNGLTEIKISSKNRYFTSVDGVLYSKDQRTLLQYPNGREAANYSVLSSVTAIADYAFANSFALRTVTLPDGLTALGDGAFQECTALEQITIPSSVTQYGNWLFNGCYSLTSVSLPDNLTRIVPNMFTYCAFSTIRLPESVTSIGYSAFEGCQSLRSITIPQSVTSIDSYAFCNSGLTSITLPAALTNLGDYAISGVSSILVDEDNALYADNDGVLVSKDKTELLQYPQGRQDHTYEVPASITKIGKSAFTDAASLRTVILPDTVTELGTAAFCQSGLTSIVIPGSIREIPENAFSYCYDLSDVTLSEGLLRIGDGAFRSTSIAQLTVPESVQSIGFAAFIFCENLREIQLPAELSELDDYAFCQCYRLKEIELPYGIPKIGESAFSQCESLSRAVIPSSVNEILMSAFYNCFNLREIEFTGTQQQWENMRIETWEDEPVILNVPVTYTGIDMDDGLLRYVIDGRSGKIALCGATRAGENATFLEIPTEIDGKPVDYIAPYAFTDCSNLRAAVLPEGITTLPSKAFYDCYRLTSIQLPESLTEIGAYAFERCESLRQILLPENLTELGEGAFSGCVSLESIRIPNGITEIPANTFQNNEKLSQLELPDGVTAIGDNAFRMCESLTALNLPDNLERIGISAFSECSALASVTIPESVSEISYAAFENCTDLRWIHLPAGLKTFDGGALSGCSRLTGIFYDGSESQWQSIWGTEYLRDYCSAPIYYNCAPVVGRFLDVRASDWFKDAVAYVYENNLMNGTSDEIFSPSGSLTRGQLVTILYRIAGEPGTIMSTSFSDVPSGKYYSNAVAWASANGIVNGYADGTFKPNNIVTREQIATILYRYAGSPAVTGTLSFPDAATAGNYAKDALLWATQEELINGVKSNGVTCLSPKSTATRAQIATIIMRYLAA